MRNELFRVDMMPNNLDYLMDATEDIKAFIMKIYAEAKSIIELPDVFSYYVMFMDNHRGIFNSENYMDTNTPFIGFSIFQWIDRIDKNENKYKDLLEFIHGLRHHTIDKLNNKCCNMYPNLISLYMSMIYRSIGKETDKIIPYGNYIVNCIKMRLAGLYLQKHTIGIKEFKWHGDEAILKNHLKLWKLSLMIAEGKCSESSAYKWFYDMELLLTYIFDKTPEQLKVIFSKILFVGLIQALLNYNNRHEIYFKITPEQSNDNNDDSEFTGEPKVTLLGKFKSKERNIFGQGILYSRIHENAGEILGANFHDDQENL